MKKRVLSLMLALAMIISTILPSISYADTPKDIGSSGLKYVNQGPVMIYGMADDGTMTNVLTNPDGSLIDPNNPPVLTVGNSLRFRVDWNIDNIMGKGLVEGDWFEFDLPSQYFKFMESSMQSLKAMSELGIEEEIGTFQIMDATDTEPAKIKVVLNNVAVEKNFINKGYIQVDAKADKVKNPNEQIQVGDWIIPELEIKPVDPNIEFPDNKPLVKSGWQITNQDKVTWGLDVSTDIIKGVYNGDITNPNVKKNLVLIDEFPEGLEYDDNSNLDLAIPIYVANENGRMSKTLLNPANGAGGWNNYTMKTDSGFNKIQQNSGESWEQFKTRVQSESSIAYGIFKDSTDNRNKLIINFGDLPGTLKSPKNLSQIFALIDADSTLTDQQKRDTKEAYNRINIATGGIEGGQDGTLALGFVLQIQGMRVTDDFLDVDRFKNEAKITWTDGSEIDDGEAIFQRIQGGAVTGEPQSVVIKKLEDGTANKLSGAKFKLQKKNQLGIWEDFNPTDGGQVERITDSNGEITYKKLSNGEYKVLEVSAPAGYSDEIRFLNGKDTFIIDGSEQGAVYITAYNKKEAPSPVNINLEGTKSLEGRTLENGEFEFVLKDKNGNEIQRVKNDATGKFSFGNISISEAGVSNYTISEVMGNQAGITYDKSIYNVEVTTTLDNATNKLVTDVKYFDAAGNDITKIQFNNKYIAPKTTEIKIGVEKELKGRAQKAREFRFLLEGETDNTGKIRELATNNISGEALFKDIELKDVGKYIYKITEVKGKDSKIKYDKSEYKLIVDVTLNSTTNEL
ncbi:Spy0128 family protein, partial [Peptostreptococcus faecalis]|uniref:Spy0128 family protein n=1 Tax=Peptostreptococcus faecalis TaxID=2045015 RepID=UPI001A9A4D7D